MTILYYFTDYQTPMYQWQHIHIIDELKAHDCNITVFDPLGYENADRANEAVLDYLKSHKIDLFMTPHNEKILFIDTLKRIKELGIPTLLICFDNLIVPFVHYRIAPYFDLVWLTSRETKGLFNKIGCRSVFLPYAANPFLARSEETVLGIGFVGTPYGSRANMINALTGSGIDVYCHCLKQETGMENGEPPLPQNDMSKKEVALEFLKFQQGRKVLEGAVINKLTKNAVLNEGKLLHKEKVVPPSDLYQVYPRYSLALSSTAARNTGVLKKPLQIVNLRSFEIPMSGGLQICQYTEEMASYFEDGKEIVFYRDEKELIEKAKYYCGENHFSERQQIRKAAREKAVAEHTWYIRFSKVFSILGLKA